MERDGEKEREMKEMEDRWIERRGKWRGRWREKWRGIEGEGRMKE